MEEQECLHTDTQVIEELPNGYYKLKCNICGEIWIEG